MRPEYFQNIFGVVKMGPVNDQRGDAIFMCHAQNRRIRLIRNDKAYVYIRFMFEVFDDFFRIGTRAGGENGDIVLHWCLNQTGGNKVSNHR
jgi:hypothetical protein